MKKEVLIVIVAISFFLSLGFANALLQNVQFNGAFQNGTTLYSNITHINQSSVWGDDAYPNRTSITTQRNCINITKTYNSSVCETINENVTTTIRIRHGYNITYQNVTRLRTVQFCHIVTTDKNVTQCKTTSTPIACLNPNSTIITNQLALENFEISTDNSTTWQPVPYYPDKLQINDTDIQFRVNIPERCSPSYFINNVIKILTFS